MEKRLLIRKSDFEPDCKSVIDSAKGVTVAQKRQLEIACHASFNKYNGPNVVKKLIENKGLWSAAVMKRPAIAFSPLDSDGRCEIHHDLFDLRDLEADVNNIDTMFIVPSQGNDMPLAKLVKKFFKADEVDYLTADEARQRTGDPRKRVLRVWWD